MPSDLTLTSIPPYIPLDDLPRYGGPERTKGYDYLNSGQLTAVKLGKRTMVTGESFIKLMKSLPTYKPSARP